MEVTALMGQNLGVNYSWSKKKCYRKHNHRTLPTCQNQNTSYPVAAAEDKHSKKKRVGDCAGSCIGVILGMLV